MPGRVPCIRATEAMSRQLMKRLVISGRSVATGFKYLLCPGPAVAPSVSEMEWNDNWYDLPAGNRSSEAWRSSSRRSYAKGY